MSSCDFKNPVTGQSSLLQENLKKALKNDDLVEKELTRIRGDKFIEAFGDWEEATRLNQDPDPNKPTPVTGIVNANGEPKLHHKKNTQQWYYVLPDGNRFFIETEGLNSEFNNEQIKDVTDYLVYQYVNAYKSKDIDLNIQQSEELDENGNEKTQEQKNAQLGLDGFVEKVVSTYYNELDKMYEANDPQRAVYEERIARVLKYSDEFKNELYWALKAFNIETKEVPEQNKDSGLNLNDYGSVDPLSSATANTRLMLSQIENRAFPDTPKDTVLGLYEDGTYFIDFTDENGDIQEIDTGTSNRDEAIEKALSVSKNPTDFGEGEIISSDFLNTPSFVPLNEVWETLQPLLADTVTTGTNDKDIISSFSKMRSKIESLKDVKPWVSNLLIQINELYGISDSSGNKITNGKNRYKAYQFVQAFNNTKINYYVSEYNRKTKTYKIMNGTSTNSRESQIIAGWGYFFKDKFLTDKNAITPDKKAELISSKTALVKDKADLVLALKQAGKDPETIDLVVSEYADRLISHLESVGVLDVTENDIINGLRVVRRDGAGTGTTLLDSYKAFERALIFAEKEEFYEKGEYVNPFGTEGGIKEFAQAVALRRTEIASSSVLANDNNNYFAYANPTYLSNKLNEWRDDNTELKQIASSEYGKNSRFAKYLLAVDFAGNKEAKQKESLRRLAEFEIGVASSFKSFRKNDGVDNKKITFEDQLNDNIVKLLGKAPYFPTIVAADKSRRIEFKGDPKMLEKSNLSLNEANEIQGLGTKNDVIRRILIPYFLDEYNRMRKVAQELKGFEESDDYTDAVTHYHLGAKNGLKSQLFPEFNFDNKNEELTKLRNLLYDENGIPLGNLNSREFTASQEGAIYGAIKNSLEKKLIETNDAISYTIQTLDADIRKKYNNNSSKIAGDYLINGLMATVEYTKLFSGDPAFYKNTVDLVKRIPATYTDGLQLVLENEKSSKFNVAVIDGVKVASRFVEEIEDSLKDKSIANSYKKVNTTDAQAWITPRRWKFIMERLGKWSSLHDKVWDKMMQGKQLSEREMKVVAQPLKGVYFERNNGVPTYLKYSQAVLIPQLVKGTSMEALYKKMTTDPVTGELLPGEKEIHEVITIDGVKVGAISPTKIHVDDTSDMLPEDEIVLNSKPLLNRGWKLQQDLPTKTMKETAIGSQIQKTILNDIALDKAYTVNGEEFSGREIYQKVNDAISTLSNLGREKVIRRLGIDSENRITNKSELYNMLSEEFRSRGGNNENIIRALDQENLFDAIPQIKGRLDSILLSIFDKEITKVKTQGGAFIQVSPFGLETIVDGEDSGIIPVGGWDGKGLKPPRIVDGVTKGGQVLIPFSLAKKIFMRIPGSDKKDMNKVDWAKLLRYEDVRTLIGYRIPNQGMSSNDLLEVVGILPEAVGDSIIGYDGIPAKTGSDFDIDKMYIMMNNILFNKKTNGFEVVQEKNKNFLNVSENEKKKLLAQNEVVSLYGSILKNPVTYDQMMRSIDSEIIKTDIAGNEKTGEVGLFPKAKINNLDAFDPVNQLKTKFEYISGKMGVALTANQLVDHVANQTLDLSLNFRLGIGPYGNLDKTPLDKDIKGATKIADILSEFLNAYVDIAKDPYISRGNHNAKTANVTFMLVRTGVPIKYINRFIGQPVLRDYVKALQMKDSITGRQFVPGDAEEFFRARKNIQRFKNSRFKLNDISEAQLEARIKNPESLPQESIDFIDSVVFNSFIEFEEMSSHLNKSMLAAKAETNGAGGSPIDLIVLNSKRTDVIVDEMIDGLDRKLVISPNAEMQDTATKTYINNAQVWVAEVLEKSEILLSGSVHMEGILSRMSLLGGKGDMPTNVKYAKAVYNSLYSYLYSGSEIFSGYTDRIDYLFKELPNKVAELKKTSNNFFIQELELESRSGYNFIGINNKNKPAQYENNIHRAWMDLYNKSGEDGRQLAIDLVVFSFAQSGFSSNLSQFFTNIPQQILRDAGVNNDVKKMFGELSTMHLDENFVEQFFRNNWDNETVVPYTIAGLGGLGTVVKDTFTPNDKFIKRYSRSKRVVKTYGLNRFPLYINIKNVLYKKESGEDLIYKKTNKLGLVAGKHKIVEYSKDNYIGNSKIESNNTVELPTFTNVNPNQPAIADNGAAINTEATDSKKHQDMFIDAQMPTESDMQMSFVFDLDMLKKAKEEGDITENGCE